MPSFGIKAWEENLSVQDFKPDWGKIQQNVEKASKNPKHSCMKFCCGAYLTPIIRHKTGAASSEPSC